MSLPLPLSVRLVTSRNDRHVTAELRNLAFRTTVPGGFASATLALDRPLSLQPDEIAYYGRVIVYDARTGVVVWEGRLEDPGRTAGPDGQVWRLTAMGPAAHTTDRTVPLIYVDRRIDPWEWAVYSSSTAQRLSAERDADTPSLRLQAQDGTALANPYTMEAIYRAINLAGQALGRVSASEINGGTGAIWANQLATRLAAGAATVADSDTWSITAGTLAASRGGGTAITAGHDVVSLRSVYTGGAANADANSWAEYYNIVIRALLKDKTGADITSGYSADTVLASEVVADLLGRLLTAYDGAGATIATTSYAIEHLAYPDGVTARKILDDLMGLEPGYFWAAYEANTAGKYRFVWQAWPSTVRYEASAVDGYDGPGSADGLYNAVRVRYRTAGGEIRTVPRTATVAELTAAGLTREAFIDLGDEVSTLANANRAGDQFLTQHGSAPNAGRLTVARPIFDSVTGRTVQPWEIQPGYLIRVRDILPRLDALNATARDAVTVFKVTAVDYNTATAAAVLELDSPPRSLPQMLAEQVRRPVYRRR